MDRKTREELNTLSKEVFGTSSRWKKIMDNGVLEPYEREREVLIPTANGRLLKKTFTDKKTVVRHYSLKEVRDLMNELLEKRKAGNAALAALRNTKEGTTEALPGDLFIKDVKAQINDVPEGETRT